MEMACPIMHGQHHTSRLMWGKGLAGAPQPRIRLPAACSWTRQQTQLQPRLQRPQSKAHLRHPQQHVALVYCSHHGHLSGGARQGRLANESAPHIRQVALHASCNTRK